ncbi:hypothetical protein [Ramlibacter albus]|uniref:Uncharacterized protein n=1 Tax=Ramlibacter albus TaxID=2079448 RepID=A0A923MEF6_9BURK|nr:hypothetical protein [Ramlibacter albus]MBC5768520.1 hypothetical protein [Ramlibacter albus]
MQPAAFAPTAPHDPAAHGVIAAGTPPPAQLVFRVPSTGVRSGDDEALAPSFEELKRCTWGTHVTVMGQPAMFSQAGRVDGRETVIVVAGPNAVLAGASRHHEPAGGGDFTYCFDYDRAQLQVGTPPAAPLLREQAAGLRAGDSVLVHGCPAMFLESRIRADELWLTLRDAPGQEAALRELGAESVDDRKWGAVWRLVWRAGLQVRLVSARLPTFGELAKLRPGTQVTIGVEGIPGRLMGTQMRDGTRQYVLVKAAPWLSVHQADSQPVGGSRSWLYRIRFQEAGLRLAGEKGEHAA